MASFNKGILGAFNGKVGTVVGSTWRGKDVMRSLPRKSGKEASLLQKMQRYRFTLVANFLLPFAERTFFIQKKYPELCKVSLVHTYPLLIIRKKKIIYLTLLKAKQTFHHHPKTPMSSTTPTIRQTAWIAIIPQLLFMGLLIFIFHQFFPKNAGLYGAFTYLMLSLTLRNYVPKSHRKGINLYSKHNYLEGIEYFQKSYSFFKQNEYLDKYRYLLLLNSSKMCYREMALNNIAFGYSQIDEGNKSKEYYERTLLEFPSNAIAKAALKMIASAEKNKDGV